jgi:hypothetical protein
MTKGYKCDKCKMFYGGEPFFIGGVTNPYRGESGYIKSTAAFHIELCQRCAAEKFEDFIMEPKQK